MSYIPTTWQDGDIITANKLNKIENGISDNTSDIKIVTVNASTSDMQSFTIVSKDKTFSEVFNGITQNNENWFAKVVITISATDQKQHIIMPILAQDMSNMSRLYGSWYDIYSGSTSGTIIIKSCHLIVDEQTEHLYADTYTLDLHVEAE